jgi:CheY-like chemotaxis protein
VIAPRFLVVDDDAAVLKVVRLAIAHLYGEDAVTAVGGGAEALAALERGRFDFVLSDLKMPRVTGLDVAREARRLRPDAIVVVMTGNARADDARAVSACGAHLLHKPFSMRELERLIEKLMALESR